MQKIKFKRADKVYTGNIVKTRENSVIVEVSKTVQKQLDISTNLTVVNFKNIIEGEYVKPKRPTKNQAKPIVGKKES